VSRSVKRTPQDLAGPVHDSVFVGLGGQGVLAAASIVAEAARRKGMPVNLCPSKGMAQRGGFVKAQLRLGRAEVGPNIPPAHADVVVAMELSEALKAVPLIRPGGDFVLCGEVWPPAAVVLGRAAYPGPEDVLRTIEGAGARALYIAPRPRPQWQGVTVALNIYLLGAAWRHTSLARVVALQGLQEVIRDWWPGAAASNQHALLAGTEAACEQA
jgi:indolepyruvate ferredoxin oxidoreductase beta subunit